MLTNQHYNGGAPGYRSFYQKLVELPDNKFKTEYYVTPWTDGSNGSTALTYKPTFLYNKVHATDVIKVKIKFKDTLIDNESIFPMMTMFPGTQVKVEKKKLVPTEIDYHKLFLDNNEWGTYRINSYTVLPYPCFRNITGRDIQVTLRNSAVHRFVPNGYICYYVEGDTDLTITTYDLNHRKVEPNVNTPFIFSITEQQG